LNSGSTQLDIRVANAAAAAIAAADRDRSGTVDLEEFVLAFHATSSAKDPASALRARVLEFVALDDGGEAGMAAIPRVPPLAAAATPATQGRSHLHPSVKDGDSGVYV